MTNNEDLRLVIQLLILTLVVATIGTVLALYGLRRIKRKLFEPSPPIEGMDEHLLLCAAVIEALPDGIVVVDSQGIVLLVNRELERMSGYHRSQLRGKVVETLIPQTLRAGHVPKRREYALDPTVRPMGTGLDTKLERADGITLPVDIALSSEPSREGTIYIATVRRKHHRS